MFEFLLKLTSVFDFSLPALSVPLSDGRVSPHHAPCRTPPQQPHAPRSGPSPLTLYARCPLNCRGPGVGGNNKRCYGMCRAFILWGGGGGTYRRLLLHIANRDWNNGKHILVINELQSVKVIYYDICYVIIITYQIYMRR